MHDHRLTGLLQRVQIPTLLVWGATDHIAPVEYSHMHDEILKDSELSVIDSCGRFPRWKNLKNL